MPFVLTADFLPFPDDLQLGPAFTLSAMDFHDILGGGPHSFVNVTGSVKGLQFPDTGVLVALPTPVSWIRLHIAQFSTPFVIESIDLSGAVVGTYTWNQQNADWHVTLNHPDVVALRFSGGGNEGVIVSISVLIP